MEQGRPSDYLVKRHALIEYRGDLSGCKVQSNGEARPDAVLARFSSSSTAAISRRRRVSVRGATGTPSRGGLLNRYRQR